MFKTLPHDVLEHVAYYASAHTLLGPPSDLVPLLLVCRETHTELCRSANPHLYARIFAAKFDLTAPRRRLARLYGQDARSVLPVNALADELVRRFAILKRLRSELDARSHNETNETFDHLTPDTEADARLDEVLWTAFLMVLEDEGRNTAQLRNARIEAWLAVFWFDGQGASGAMRRLTADHWPVTPAYSVDLRQRTRHALGMWLFWFFLNPAAYVANPDLYRRAERSLKLVALNAPLYPLSHLPWTSFNPEPTQIHFGVPGSPTSAPFDPGTGSNPQSQQSALETSCHFMYFGYRLPQLRPLPPAIPANLALLALHARSRRNADTLGGGLDILELFGPSLTEAFIALPEQRATTDSGLVQASPVGRTDEVLDTSVLNGRSKHLETPVKTNDYRWECEWLRCVYAVDQNGALIDAYSGGHEPNSVAGSRNADTRIYKTYQPGSLEGSWEGPFTYTEFHSFAALLAGASPSKLQDCLVAQHNQTWRLREYHLLSPSSSIASSQTNGTQGTPIPLPVGNAMLAHIPEDVAVQDDSSSMRITLPSSFSSLPSSTSTNEGTLPTVYTYARYRGPGSMAYERAAKGSGALEDDKYACRVLDIVLSGEGHSGWGEFRLLGRVRPTDGFISIIKEYTGGDRGRWLYRGYLVGGGSAALEGKSGDEIGEDNDVGESKGYIVGRWRDMLTPPETHGYEGAFAMACRR